jgi:hypothetical protein
MARSSLDSMSSPVLIDGPNVFPSWASSSPIKIGANLYAPCVNRNGGDTLAMYKSLDNGATWSRMDMAHEYPVALVTLPSGCYDLGTQILLVSSAPAGGGAHNQISVFDLSNDTWHANNVTALVSTVDATASYFVLSNGVMYFAGLVPAFSFGSTYRSGYFTVDPVTALATSVWLPCGETLNTTDVWQVSGMFTGAANSLWFVFEQLPIAGGTKYLVLQSLILNVLSGLTQIDSGNYAGVGANFYYPPATQYSDGTRVLIAWAKTDPSLDADGVMNRLVAPLVGLPGGFSITSFLTLNSSIVSLTSMIEAGSLYVVRSDFDTVMSTNPLYLYKGNLQSLLVADLLAAPSNVGTGLLMGPVNSLGVVAAGPLFSTSFLLIPFSAGVKMSAIAGGAVIMPSSGNQASGALCRFARPLRSRQSNYPIVTTKVLMKLS